MTVNRLIKPMDIRQKIVAATTGLGWRVPHAAYVYEADLTGAVSFLRGLNEAGNNPKITLNTLLIYIIVRGIMSCPVVNSRIAYNKWLARGHLELLDTIDVNMPVMLPSGKMFTVKLPDVGGKSLAETQLCVNQLTEKIANTEMDIPLLRTGLRDTFHLLLKGDIVRPAGRLLGLKLGRDKIERIPKHARKKYASTPAGKRINASDIDMGTVTISNLGSLVKNTRGFPALIDIITPQIFAAGIGPVYDAPAVFYNGDIPETRVIKNCSMLFVFDHRALDFGDIAPLIKKIDCICEIRMSV